MPYQRGEHSRPLLHHNQRGISTPWWHQPSSMGWSSGAAASRQLTGGDWRLDKLVRKASSVLGCPLDTVEVVGDRRMMAKLSSLMSHASHPMQDTLAALHSSFSHRLIHPRCLRERYRKSFLPAAVRLHNKLLSVDH